MDVQTIGVISQERLKIEVKLLLSANIGTVAARGCLPPGANVWRGGFRILCRVAEEGL